MVRLAFLVVVLFAFASFSEAVLVFNSSSFFNSTPVFGGDCPSCPKNVTIDPLLGAFEVNSSVEPRLGALVENTTQAALDLIQTNAINALNVGQAGANASNASFFNYLMPIIDGLKDAAINATVNIALAAFNASLANGTYLVKGYRGGSTWTLDSTTNVTANLFVGTALGAGGLYIVGGIGQYFGTYLRPNGEHNYFFDGLNPNGDRSLLAYDDEGSNPITYGGVERLTGKLIQRRETELKNLTVNDSASIQGANLTHRYYMINETLAWMESNQESFFVRSATNESYTRIYGMGNTSTIVGLYNIGDSTENETATNKSFELSGKGCDLEYRGSALKEEIGEVGKAINLSRVLPTNNGNRLSAGNCPAYALFNETIIVRFFAPAVTATTSIFSTGNGNGQIQHGLAGRIICTYLDGGGVSRSLTSLNNAYDIDGWRTVACNFLQWINTTGTCMNITVVANGRNYGNYSQCLGRSATYGTDSAFGALNGNYTIDWAVVLNESASDEKLFKWTQATQTTLSPLPLWGNTTYARVRTP